MAFTFFFRDLDTIELAVDHLVQSAMGRSRVRVWDAGSAMGQEPYTLAIVLAERMGNFAFRNLEIVATDYDAPLLEILRKGVYPADQLQRVPPDLFERYFEPLPGKEEYQLCDAIRSRVISHLHDLRTFKPIRTGFSLVVCKNVLLHFSPAERVQVIKMFHDALEPGGLLAMEHTQKLPAELSDMFEHVAKVNQVYRKAAA